jgi:hypothetical protein
MRLMAYLVVCAAPLALLVGCGDVAGLREGDVVVPILEAPKQWNAGAHGQISVRLQAKGKDGSKRPLGFDGIPENSNPRATVTFYFDRQAQPPIEVALDHRC